MQEGAAGEWEEQVLLSAPEDSLVDKPSSFEQLEAAVVIDPDPDVTPDTPLWAWLLLVAAVRARHRHCAAALRICSLAMRQGDPPRHPLVHHALS